MKNKKYNKNLKLSQNLEGMDESIFEQIVEHFPDIIHSVDNEGLIVSTNRFASNLLGYSRDELLGKSIYDIYPKEIADQVKVGFEDLKKTGFKDRVESKLETKDGTIIDVEIRSLSLYDNEGKFIRTFSIIRDIRELNSLKEQLIHHSKLAAIGELAAGIMHDVRNPLTVINSYNNVFLKEAIEEKDIELMEKCQSAVEKAAERIQRLSDHMRNFARSEKDPLGKVNLSEVINDCLLMVESKIKGSGAKIDISGVEKDLEFYCFPNRIEQVLINVLSNACDAVEQSIDKSVVVEGRMTPNTVAISIADKGPGISEENQKKIFESFFTTKGKGRGTGLGLSISQGIIYELGGAITLESSPGKGAKFIISIPKLKPAGQNS